MVDEIRRHRRVEGPVFVEYRLLNGSQEHGVSPAINVSQSGACFGVTQHVSAQAAMELQLHVGRLGSEPITVRGHIVWVRPSNRQDFPYEVGFEFTEANPRQIARLLQRIQIYWRHLTQSS